MITQKWVESKNAEHEFFTASSDLKDQKGKSGGVKDTNAGTGAVYTLLPRVVEYHL